MKNIIIPFILLCSFIFSSCEKEPVEIPEENLPEVEILNLRVFDNTLVFAEIFVENSDTLYYRLNQKDSESEWEKMILEGDGQLALEFNAQNSYETDLTYTLETYSSRADKSSEIQSKSVTVSKANYITVENIKAAATAFSADFAINRESGAEGFCVKAFLKEEWTEEVKEQFRKDCIPEMWPAVPTYDKDTLVKIESLKSEKDYILAILPVKINADNPAGPVGTELVSENIMELEFSTIKFELNQTDDHVSLELVGEPDYTYINVRLSKGTPSVSGYIIGAVSKNDLTGSLDAYLQEWLYEKTAMGYCNYESIHPFRGMDFQPCDEVETGIGNLQDNTDYTIFAIAIDTYGFAGKVSTLDAKTKGIEFDSDASLEISITEENLTDIGLSLEFNSTCAKAVYITSDRGALTEKDAAAQLIQSYLEFMSCWTSDMKEARISGLKPDKEYDLWVLPKDAEGKYGKIIKKEFKTGKVEFNYASELEISVSDIQTENGAKYALANVTKGENCVKFMYLGAPMGELNTLYPDGPTPEQCVEWMLTQPQAKVSESDLKDFRFDIWFGPHIFIAAPMDKDGVFGTPKIHILENE